LPNTTLQQNRKDIQILIGISQTQLRSALQLGLREVGFESFRSVRDVDELENSMTAMVYDLILIDPKLEGGDSFDLIKRIRAGDVGHNAYLVIVMLSWSTDVGPIKAAINSGVDDVQVFPITPRKLISRAANFSSSRKPFIVTSDYIGPDRRSDPGRASSIPTIEMPNTFALKESGKSLSQIEIKKMVDDVKALVNDERLRRIGFQISFLVNLILSAFKVAGNASPETVANIAALKRMSAEAVARLSGSSYEGAMELCTSMSQVASEIDRERDAPLLKQTRLLGPLSMAILRSFYPSDAEDALAGQIANAVTGFRTRAARRLAPQESTASVN
jgi:DNA-binding response OmpR family regulator